MRGNEAVLEFLNDVLTAELTAINQYFIDSKMMANWGYQRLADKVRADSIDEMGDVEKLIDRILYLDGVPNLQRLGSVRVGETVPEKLRLALDLERTAIERFNSGVATWIGAGDHGSRELLDHILEGEKTHPDRGETPLQLL